jgi:hypothetical protein
MRFAIRDMLWLIVVLAVGLGWVRAESARRRTHHHAARLLAEFQQAKWDREHGLLGSANREVNWKLADQPIP